MKTKLETASVMQDYLEMLECGYVSGDFLELFPHLAEDCVMESQWVLIPNEGRPAVIDYLQKKGETLQNTDAFPSCSMQEMICPAREPCMLMQQTVDGKTNEVLLRIELNAEEKISRIVLCRPELCRYRGFYTFAILYPCVDEETMLDSAKIHINEFYYNELYLFLGMVGEAFDEYGDIHIPMEKWLECLACWKRFYSFETFDEAFEDACGIDYTNFTVCDETAGFRLGHYGDEIWYNRKNQTHIIDDLIEWTNKYKDTWSHIHIYGV